MIWWHRFVRKHTVTYRAVSVPWWDIRAKGFLVDCSCGKRWAL